MGFLENLVKVFPNLASRPLHLTGESYAGMYIVSTVPPRQGLHLQHSPQPYITKAYFEMDNPPVNLARIAIGDGSIASGETFMLLPVVSALETYPQIIGYDTDVLEYFREQCVKTYAMVSEVLIYLSGPVFVVTILPSSILNLNPSRL